MAIDTENKDVVRAFYTGSSRNVAASFAEWIDPGVMNHGMEEAGTRDAWQAYDTAFFAAFDDAVVQVLDQVEEGGKVATRWVFSGRHARELAGLNPTGSEASLRATTIDRVVDGRIVEHWIDSDVSGFLRQLGAE